VSAKDSLTQWRAGLERMIGPFIHVPILNALAAISLAMTLARSCRSLEVASHMSGATPASARRRLERLLANDHLDVMAIYAPLNAALGRSRCGRRLTLILDESDRDTSLRSLQILAAIKRRCLPLLALAYPSDRPPMPMGQLVLKQLEQVHQWLAPYDLKITLLADRGLAWPSLVRLCRRLGWHYVLRLQGSTHWRDNVREGTVKSLLSGRRQIKDVQVLKDDVHLFKKAGWIDHCCITAVHHRGCKSAWFLLSDLPAGYARVQRYCVRMWCEESFRDQKSSGIRWRDSRVNDLAHATRLLLLIALALWLCLLCGLAVVRNGWRRRLDCHRNRLLSYFKIGLFWLQSFSLNPDQPSFAIGLEGI
jgi:hypothetical protein